MPTLEDNGHTLAWGPWKLHRNSVDLVLVDGEPGRELYFVSLSRMTGSAAALDWIVQVAQKSWATQEIIAQLVGALCDILTPQERLCGNGVDSKYETHVATKWATGAFKRITTRCPSKEQ